MSNSEFLDNELTYEFENAVYDILGEAIDYTRIKHNYKKYDLVKLIMMLYENDYSFLSNYNGYREQFKLLNDYFFNKYGFNVITFVMLRYVISFKDEKFDDIMQRLAEIEAILRNGRKAPVDNLSIFSSPIKKGKYGYLMMMIESESSFKYALAIVYDMLKNDWQKIVKVLVYLPYLKGGNGKCTMMEKAVVKR